MNEGGIIYNMKLITFAVPCYNSESYMSKCVNSLLTAGNDAQIIIIDDGSKDKTGEIADDFAEKYPSIVKVIHQENGGHGEGVNQGIINAEGKYFKVVDSDDWLDEDALSLVMDKLREMEENNITLDALFANYVYEHCVDDKKHAIKYKKTIPVERIFSWSDIGKFTPPNYILMHSVIYRTQILRDSKISLPKHTFYVDNIFVYQPLPYLKTMYYMDVDLYRYYTGRDEQSVNEKNMIRQIDQQIYITKYLVDLYEIDDISEKNEKLGKYMLHYLSMMFAVCFIFLTIENTDESLEKIKQLKQYLKEKRPSVYNKIIYGSIAFFSNIPTNIGRKSVVACYRVLKKIYKFN
jgi:glycosyltransferase involved in cell wall biosynthesis